MSSRKSVWKELKYWAVAMLIMAILFEIVSSMFFSYKYGGGKFALQQTAERFVTDKPQLSHYHKIQNEVRPDSSAETSRRIADEIWDANKYSYEPWLQFKVTDLESKYVNIKGFDRKSIPSEFINPKSKDTFDIYFFGGSTMYGYNVSDAETIPSQFLKLYKEKYPNGKSVRIRNLGIPYYFSKQELLLYSKLLFEGERPDIVVFMDGLNDFYPSRMLYYDKPHFSYAMQQVFDEQIFLKKKRTIVDSSENFYLDVPNLPANEYYETLMQKYLNHVKQGTKLSDAVGIKSFFFCQPVPFYNYPNRDKDPISYKVSYPRFDYIYPKLAQQSIPNFRFLGNMLENEKGLPFVDQVHYSPAFCTKIAQEMLGTIENSILEQ